MAFLASGSAESFVATRACLGSCRDGKAALLASPALRADVLLAGGSAGLRQDVPVLQRAESTGIGNRLGTSASNSEFLGKRIWQSQAVSAGRLSIAGEGQHLCMLAVLFALPCAC